MTDSKSNQFVKRVMSDRMRWMAKWLRLRDYALSENTLKEYLFITYNAARSVWPFRYAARKVYCLNQKANIPLGNDALHNLIQKAEQREQRKTNTEVVSRLTAVEASAKQAHQRINGLENRIK